MANRRETPDKSTRWNGKSYTFSARMIQTSARASQGGRGSRRARAVDAESGPFEPARHLRDGQRAEGQLEAVLRRAAAAALDVLLIERREAAPRGPAGPIRRASGARRRADRPAQLDAVPVFAPVGHVGNQIDAERPAAPRARAPPSRASRARSRSRMQRLQDAVRREHHREAPAPERQRADVGRGPSGIACETFERRATRLARAASIGSDRSTPTRLTPAARERNRDAAGAAAELEHRPAAPRRPRGARRRRRAGRASARSPSRRTARTRPSLPNPRVVTRHLVTTEHRDGHDRLPFNDPSDDQMSQ